MFNKLKIQSYELRLAYKELKEINKLKESYQKLSDEELRNKTHIFRERLKKGEKLKDIRIEAFATAREATFRVLKKFPYDVQMVGGLILDYGSVAEMKTGEGKTITSIAPVYLNALEGKGVIVSTVNEYLTERDAEEMGQVHNFLGLSVGVNKAGLDPYLKKYAYSCDITYSIHSELGFDYLRDNMVTNLSDKVQRGLNFILVDEIDSILIDDARTPLIISGGDGVIAQNYAVADQFVRTLKPNHYKIDQESKTIKLTDEGIDYANSFFRIENLYDIVHSELVHRIQNSLRAHKIMSRDIEYIVHEEKILLVDTFTGRVMDGRSYSEGLQQAIQAKENLEIEPETITMATITYQNFFRMAKKLSGMTGTAKTEEREFIDIYNMRVHVIPTNKPMIRVDYPDQIYNDLESKYQAIVDEIKRVYKTKQPMLIGTAQVNESEYLSERLKKENIPHTVLNAKQNEQEAEIISKAGEVGNITIATNMAGRGTDIKLSKEALELGGLYVLGTDRAESRRIDNQLRGRSGRQGDIGCTKFFLSMDDQLFLRFSLPDKWKEVYKNNKNKNIEGKTIQNLFTQAQKKIEGFNYDTRKSVLNYDDVIRQQRDLVYQQRDLILETEDLHFVIERMIKRTVPQILDHDSIKYSNGEHNYQILTQFVNENFLQNFDEKLEINEVSQHHGDFLVTYLEEFFLTKYDEVRKKLFTAIGEPQAFNNEKNIILQNLDLVWQKHINNIDKLRSSSNVVQYSQKNPYQTFTENVTKKFKILIESTAYNSVNALMNNPNAILPEYEDIILSDGSLLSLPKDLHPEVRQSILDESEFVIKRKIEAQNLENEIDTPQKNENAELIENVFEEGK